MHLLITKGHGVTDKISKELREYDVSEPQYNVLRILFEAKDKPMAVQAVQGRMVQQGSNVTRIVDKLQTKGYVQRCECPTNRRKMDLTLTEEGKKFLKILDKKVNEIHAPLMHKYDANELETLTQLLSKIEIE